MAARRDHTSYLGHSFAKRNILKRAAGNYQIQRIVGEGKR